MKKRDSFTNFFINLAIILSFIGIVFTFYKSEILFQGILSGNYLKYYVIFIFSAVFWIFIRKQKNTLRQRAVLLSLGFLLGLYTFEAFYSIYKLNNDNSFRITKAKQLNVDFDKRSLAEIIEDLNKNSLEKAFPLIAPQNFTSSKGLLLEGEKILFPLSGISSATTILCNESGKWSSYKSDRYGFNNPDKEWDSTELSWLMVGDSFANGSCVDAGKDIMSQIRNLSNENGITLGMGGNGPYIVLASIVEYAKVLKPKKVLWLYFENNDIYVNPFGEGKVPLLASYLKKGFTQNLIKKQNSIDKGLLMFYEDILKKKDFFALPDFYDFIFLRNIRLLIGFDNTPYGNEQIMNPEFELIMRRAKEEVNKWGGEVFFIYLPEFSRYSFNNNNQENLFFKDSVIEIVSNLNIPVIDIHEQLFKIKDNPRAFFSLGVSGHYTEEAYLEIAEIILLETEETTKD